MASKSSSQSKMVLTAPNNETDQNRKQEVTQTYSEQDRMDVYKQICQQTEESRLKHSELFDQSVLTLSSGALVLSMAFIKDIVPLSRVIWTQALFLSWMLFAGSILSTLLSFISSQKAHEINRECLDAYFLSNEEDARNRPNKYTTITVLLNRISVICFFLAVVITIAFCWKNISQEQAFSIETNKVAISKQKKEGEKVKQEESVPPPDPHIQEANTGIPKKDDGLGAKPTNIPDMPSQTKDPGKK